MATLQLTITKQSPGQPQEPQLVQRQLQFTFVKATGTFASSGTDTISVAGVRASAKITNAGGASMPGAQVEIYGLGLSLMNDLSTLGLIINQVQRNVVMVKAGDQVNGFATVFAGEIQNGWIDFNAQPQVAFRIIAYTGGSLAVIAAQPNSFQGSVDVATILSGLAVQMGWRFENNGVQARIASQYLYGSARDQAIKVVRIAGIESNGGEGQVLSIWPRGGSRKGPAARPLVSPSSGMVGYPTFTQNGLDFKTVFNPSIQFGIEVEVQSSLKAASQVVKVIGLDHDLQSQVPGGQWFSMVRGYNPASPLPPVTSVPG